MDPQLAFRLGVAGVALVIGYLFKQWGDNRGQQTAQRDAMREYRRDGGVQLHEEPPATTRTRPAASPANLSFAQAEELVDELGADEFPGLPARIRLRAIPQTYRPKWAAMLKAKPRVRIPAKTETVETWPHEEQP